MGSLQEAAYERLCRWGVASRYRRLLVFLLSLMGAVACHAVMHGCSLQEAAYERAAAQVGHCSADLCAVHKCLPAIASHACSCARFFTLRVPLAWIPCGSGLPPLYAATCHKLQVGASRVPRPQ